MSTSTDADFLIAGAGIGGLATALALSVRGHEVLVLEGASGLGEIGAGIQLAPNALRVLDELGVLDDVYANASRPPKGTMRHAFTGETITVLDFGEPFVERYGYPYIVTHRADLHESLLRSCKATGRVTVLTDQRVTAVDETDERAGRVVVTTASGQQFSGGVVVGADGLRSVVRQHTIGDGAAEAMGDVAFRGTVSTTRVRERDGKDHMTWWVGPSMHLIQYPVRGGQMMNQVAVIAPDGTGPRSDGEQWGSADDLDRLFGGTTLDVEAGVALVDRGARWQLFDRPPAPSWTRGRVTLVGDAAHPMLQYLAQGGCQALEDAVVLAASFDAHPDDARAALAAYEAERVPRTAEVQTWARRMGEIVHGDGTLAMLRDALLRLRSEDDYAYVDWLYGYRRPVSRAGDLG